MKNTGLQINGSLVSWQLSNKTPMYNIGTFRLTDKDYKTNDEPKTRYWQSCLGYVTIWMLESAN